SRSVTWALRTRCGSTLASRGSLGRSSGISSTGRVSCRLTTCEDTATGAEWSSMVTSYVMATTCRSPKETSRDDRTRTCFRPAILEGPPHPEESVTEGEHGLCAGHVLVGIARLDDPPLVRRIQVLRRQNVPTFQHERTIANGGDRHASDMRPVIPPGGTGGGRRRSGIGPGRDGTERSLSGCCQDHWSTKPLPDRKSVHDLSRNVSELISMGWVRQFSNGA